MSKSKTAKFAELGALPNVFEYPFGVLKSGVSFPYKGRWHEEVFHNDHPIVLELGCGKGEYTVGLAERFPEKNFIGIDIKGNRMWTGASEAHRKGLPNAYFLRTEIELADRFFEKGEVDEIWITFPDPQMKKVRKRLTSTGFLKLYRMITGDGALLHLKTDSPFLYGYTKALAEAGSLTVLTDQSDVHGTLSPENPLRAIRTYYENQWLQRGLTIKYLAIVLDEKIDSAGEPDIDIEFDTYRSFGRNYSSLTSDDRQKCKIEQITK